MMTLVHDAGISSRSSFMTWTGVRHGPKDPRVDLFCLLLAFTAMPPPALLYADT